MKGIPGPPPPAPASQVSELQGVVEEEVGPARAGAAPRTLDDLLDLDELEAEMARNAVPTGYEYGEFEVMPED